MFFSRHAEFCLLRNWVVVYLHGLLFNLPTLTPRSTKGDAHPIRTLIWIVFAYLTSNTFAKFPANVAAIRLNCLDIGGVTFGMATVYL